MSDIDKGGPAFPVFAEQYSYGIGEKAMHTKFDGMQLRDYFAAKAMQGICTLPETWGLTLEGISSRSYSIADAMLKARQK